MWNMGNTRRCCPLPRERFSAGGFPAAKLRLVQAWIEIHREELRADWDLAVQGEAVFRIEPLR
ncbi:DUF4160 domain-containing protein [Paramagnetospirillum caucaseum]|uniref:DUF4160 domain-containing protein n=1 Tax=Paramagnetospirillum caucaseum TaxID=1244869 RepID=UPI003898D5F0